MAEGAMYVEVEGNVVNYGINTLSTSGDDRPPDEGDTQGRYWLHWTYDSNGVGGFNNRSWYWDISSNYLGTVWEEWRVNTQYSGTDYANLEGFQKYLIDATPSNLDHLFSIWDSKYDKSDFAWFLVAQTGNWENGGCVEFT